MALLCFSLVQILVIYFPIHFTHHGFFYCNIFVYAHNMCTGSLVQFLFLAARLYTLCLSGHKLFCQLGIYDVIVIVIGRGIIATLIIDYIDLDSFLGH